jgi:hypothetical protein
MFQETQYQSKTFTLWVLVLKISGFQSGYVCEFKIYLIGTSM